MPPSAKHLFPTTKKWLATAWSLLYRAVSIMVDGDFVFITVVVFVVVTILLGAVILHAVVQVAIGLYTLELDELVGMCCHQLPWCRQEFTIQGFTIEKPVSLETKHQHPTGSKVNYAADLPW
jgi:hypothetical protein